MILGARIAPLLAYHKCLELGLVLLLSAQRRFSFLMFHIASSQHYPWHTRLRGL